MEQDKILHPTWPSCLTFSAAGQFGSIEIRERGKGRHMAGVGLDGKAMTPDYKAISAELNAGEVTLKMLNDVLADYKAKEYGTLKGDVLPFLLVIATRLRKAGKIKFSLDWFKSNVEHPTHYRTNDDKSTVYVYKYSEEHIGMVTIKDNEFIEYSRLCCVSDPAKFWRSLTPWSAKMEWKGQSAQQCHCA